MKYIVVDSSSIISLSSNCLLWIVEKFKDVKFVLTPEVKKEVLENPLLINRFKLEGFRVMKYFHNGVFQVLEADKKLTRKLLNLANSIFSARGKYIKILHKGEISLFSLGYSLKAHAILIDERITSRLITKPELLKEILESRLHERISVNEHNLHRFKSIINTYTIIKSSDLVSIAFEKGYFDKYLEERGATHLKKSFLEGVLWGLKDSGCAISMNDIREYLRVVKI